jgi:hypothetical protein
MSGRDASFERGGEKGCRRRAFLGAATATYVLTFVPDAMAQPAADIGRGTFLAVSKLLTGRPSLDAGQAGRLYEALTDDDLEFQSRVQALLSWIDRRKIDMGHLQSTLDSEEPGLADLPRRIVSAWYTGVVGEGARARCITFETSLMHVAVADRLNPPSYCHGPHGNWLEAPV